MWFKIAVLIIAASVVNANLSPRKLYKEDSDDQITPFTDPYDGIDYRLPNSTIPLRYDIWLSTDIHRGVFDFSGRVTIQIEALENTATVTVQIRELTIVNVDLYNAFGVLIQSSVPWTTQDNVEFLIIRPTVALVASQIYSLEVTYNGVLRDDDAGFYRSSYTDSIGNTVWLATTQFESTDARHAFPCYDEPAIRSIYSIEIRHDDSYHAVSNMPEQSRLAEAGGNYVVTKFDEIESVQSYLIAFTISDFLYIQDTTRATPQRIFAKPQSIAAGDGAVALEASGKLLSGFEDYLKVEYTLPKMDQAAMPDFAAGAMENWGLVTYREQYLLFNEMTSTTRDRENVVATISHEFAHQWFGNLVSPAWWSYLWLNEGFATLYENHLTGLVYPGERWIDTFLIDTVQPVFENDASASIRPMSHYVESPARIDNLFDSVAYSKSGSVLKMFQNAFGDTTWTKGLTNYLNARRLNYGTPDYLYAGLQTAVDEDNPTTTNRPNVATVMKSWETQSGFPYITVTRNGNQLTFEQNRFLYTNRTSPNLWWVPLNYVVGSNANFTVTKPDLWLEGVTEVSIQSATAPKAFTANDWIVVNIQQSSFYRVNYDNTLWNLIIEQLNSAENAYSQIHLFNRAQLVDDSFHLARGGLINYDIVFGVLNYLEKETDYIPWASTNRANTLLNRWLSGSTAYAHYQAFMRKNVEAIFNRLGTEVINNEPRVDRYARTVAINIACQSQSDACLTQSNRKLQSMLDSGVALSPDLVSSIYCNGIRTANTTTFLAMQNKFLQSTLQTERNTIIAALGCTQNAEILTHYLNLALVPGNPMSSNEKSRILSSPMNNGEASISTMISFVNDNAHAISSINLLTTMCGNIASRVSNQRLLTEFTSLLTLLSRSSLITENQVTTYTNSANTIIDWQTANLRYIEGFFSDDGSTANPTSTTIEPTTLGAGNVVLSTVILAFSILAKYLL